MQIGDRFKNRDLSPISNFPQRQFDILSPEFPLTEGSLSPDCILTCNWHNWKFDLADGRNLYGGDRLRIYPVELRGDDIWIDLADPPFAERYAAITTSLRNAFDAAAAPL